MGAERRACRRSRSFAQVLIVLEGRMGYVADMSERGFRGLFLDGQALIPGSIRELEMAFSEIEIAPFPLEVLVRWSRIEEGSVEAGLELTDRVSEAGLVDFEAIGVYYSESDRDKC
jgi:hypothetical protein